MDIPDAPAERVAAAASERIAGGGDGAAGQRVARPLSDRSLLTVRAAAAAGPRALAVVADGRFVPSLEGFIVLGSVFCGPRETCELFTEIARR